MYRFLESEFFITMKQLVNRHLIKLTHVLDIVGPGSIVGIATVYGLDGPGIETWWGRDFLHLSRPALRPTQPPGQWVQGLSQG